MVTPSANLTSDFVPFVGDPRECRGDVAFPPSLGPQPSGAIEETGTILNPRFVAWPLDLGLGTHTLRY